MATIPRDGLSVSDASLLHLLPRSRSISVQDQRFELRGLQGALYPVVRHYCRLLRLGTSLVLRDGHHCEYRVRQCTRFSSGSLLLPAWYFHSGRHVHPERSANALAANHDGDLRETAAGDVSETLQDHSRQRYNRFFLPAEPNTELSISARVRHSFQSIRVVHHAAGISSRHAVYELRLRAKGLFPKAQ